MKKIIFLCTIIFVFTLSCSAYAFTFDYYAPNGDYYGIGLTPPCTGSEMTDYKVISATCSNGVREIELLFNKYLTGDVLIMPHDEFVIEINSSVKIWAFAGDINLDIGNNEQIYNDFLSGNIVKSHAPFLIYKLNGSTFEDTGLVFKHNFVPKWSEVVSLPAGTYKFISTATSFRDFYEAGEWFFETISEDELTDNEIIINFEDIKSSLEAIAKNQSVLNETIKAQSNLLISKTSSLSESISVIKGTLSYIQGLEFIFTLLFFFVLILYIFYCCLSKFF